jgi:predicted  nucleic acid-binding Zn-ribbon protein
MMIGIIEARNLPVIIVANKIDLPDAPRDGSAARSPSTRLSRSRVLRDGMWRPLRDHARILRVRPMPHKCTKCGREYKDGSTEILKGCASCGGKKFLYVKEDQINRDVLEEKSIEEIAEESREEVLEVSSPSPKKRWRCMTGWRPSGSSRPGSYELNLEKMAQSDERIVSVGKEGSVTSSTSCP